MGVNITTIAYLRVLIIGIGSSILLMVVEAQGRDALIRFLLGGSGCYKPLYLHRLEARTKRKSLNISTRLTLKLTVP